MQDHYETRAILPADPSKVTAVCDGLRWLYDIRPGTVKVGNGAVSFDIRWHSTGEIRHYTLALDSVTGYEESK